MRNIIELISRRFPTIVWITLVVFLVIAAATYLATPMYTSEARITVPIGQESTLPTTALTAPLYVYITRAEQIQTQIEVLQSRNLIEKTIDELPEALFEPEEKAESDGVLASLRKRLGEVTRGARAEVRKFLEKAKISPRMSEREQFILSCASRLDIKRRRETDVIGLSFKDRSPYVAQIFLNKFLEVYVREKSTNDSSVTVPFFAEQEQKLRDDLVEARRALNDFRQEWGILDLPSQREALLSEDGRILSEINQAQAELVQIEVSLASFQEAVGHEAPESVLPARVREDLGIAETLRNLATLRARESRLWSEVGENHPDMTNIQSEVTRLRAHILTEGQNMLNSRAHTLKSLLNELKSQRDNIHNQILTLESKSREMLTLETEVTVLETALGQYAERRETTRMSAAIEAQQINAINIVEPPNLAYKPSSPVVVVNLVLGLMFGAVLALAYVFTRNRFSTTIYTPEDLHEAFSYGQSRGESADGKDNSPPITQLPDLLYPRAQGYIRRLVPIPRRRNPFAKPDAVVRKMPENALTMMGRKFFYSNNQRHIPSSLMLSGTGDKVGSSTCAKLLAEHLRKTYACRILIVETTFRRSKDRNTVVNGRDFATWLRGVPFPEPEEVTVTKDGDDDGMIDVLPAGVLDDWAQAAVFGLTREKLDVLRNGYDVLIFDAEPVIRSSIALHMAALVDDVILVARSEVTRREVLHSIQDTLDQTGGKLTGAICNFRRFYIPNWVYRLLR